MRFLEMAQNLAARDRREGGIRFLTPEGVRPATPEEDAESARKLSHLSGQN
jgi:hypothetical protein